MGARARHEGAIKGTEGSRRPRTRRRESHDAVTDRARPLFRSTICAFSLSFASPRCSLYPTYTHSTDLALVFHPKSLFCSISLRNQAMSPQPPVTLISDGTPLNVPQEPPPPYPSRERRHRRRRTAVESSGGDSDDHAFLGTAHPPPQSPHPDESTPLLGVSSPTRRTRTMSLSSAASISPSLAQTVISAFRMDLDSDGEDGEDGEETPRDRLAVGTLPDDHLSHAPALIRHRARGWRTRWRHYFRPIGRRAYWSALLHLLVINFPYALLAWVYLFAFTLVSDSTWRDGISNLLMNYARNAVR
jgi:hypothetical protein